MLVNQQLHNSRLPVLVASHRPLNAFDGLAFDVVAEPDHGAGRDHFDDEEHEQDRGKAIQQTVRLSDRATAAKERYEQHGHADHNQQHASAKRRRLLGYHFS